MRISDWSSDVCSSDLLITNKTELSEKRLQLLRSGSTKEPVIGKLVCSCSQVGEGNLTNLAQSGYTDLNALCEASGAGTGCGSCRPQVMAILEGFLAETEKGDRKSVV